MTMPHSTRYSTKRKTSEPGSLLERLGPIMLGIGVVVCGVLVSPTVKESNAAVYRIKKASSPEFFEPHTNSNMGLNVTSREIQRDSGTSLEVRSDSSYYSPSRRVERGSQLIGGNEVFIAQR